MSEQSQETKSIFHLFDETTKKFPNNAAIACDEHLLSYQDLEIQVNKLAYYLQLLNIDTDKPIIILLERSIYCFVSMLAIIKLGGTYVPIETEYPDERINMILDDVDYSLIITSDEQSSRENLNINNKKSFNIDKQLETLRNMPDSIAIKTSEVDPNKTCYIIYTSGSTGKPKGVEITYQNILHYVKAAQKQYEINYKDIIYQGFSLAFDASLEEIWMAFANGAKLTVATDKALRSGLDLHLFLNTNNVTVLSTVPSLLNNINEDIPSVRLLILGGEVCTPKIINKWHKENRRIFNTYGPTETTVVATALECFKNIEITIGKPLLGYEAIIIDEYNNLTNNIGELCIGGPSVAKGYVNRQDLTKQKFILDPRGSNKIFYKTGDKAEITKNGEIKFYGRIDDQVKIRGFRVELSEIEAVINDHPHVKQSIAVYNLDGDQQLTAYLIPEKNQQLDLNSIREYFKKTLPDYMNPNNIEIIKRAPLLPSGKIDKSKLPKPHTNNDKFTYVAPSNQLETVVTEIWEKIFNVNKISAKADFFYDLGGNSLLAAKAISEMRNIDEFRKISLGDLYNTPNIIDITKKFINSNKTENKKHHNYESTKTSSYKVPGWKHKLCGFAQFLGCLLHYSLYTWEFLIFYGIYLSISKFINNSTLNIFYTITLSVIAYPLITISITVLSKWVLVGRIKEGKHKLWGFYYFRWWLYSRIAQIQPVTARLTGTPLIRIYFLLLGAKIGKNCYINTQEIYAPDLLTIGDNTSIGTNTNLNGYCIEDGWLTIYPIKIGKNCYVGSECTIGKNVVMNDDSYLEHMSLIPDNMELYKNEFYAGSPCQKISIPEEHIINQNKQSNKDKETKFQQIKFSVLHLFALMILTLIHIAAYVPIAIGLGLIIKNKLDYFILFYAPLVGMLYVPIYLTVTVLIKRYMLRNIKPGTYSIFSITYLRQWIITKMLNSPEILLLGDSIFFPIFLRSLGAKIGKGVEFGDADALYPDFIHLDNESFVASGTFFAEPSVYKNQIKYNVAKINNRGFIGNLSLLPNGATIGKDSLLGAASITPYNNKAAAEKTSWLGSQAMFLPKREIIDIFTDDLKFKPSKKLKAMRCAIEFLRITLPFCLYTFYAFVFIQGFLWLKDQDFTTLILGISMLSIACSLGMVSFVIIMKWLLIGKIKPDMKPLWHSFIWKNDLILYWYDVIVLPLFLNFTLGTPFANIFWRSIGAKVGKKVMNESSTVSEADLITIGDYACINYKSNMLTHLYEDRIYKTSNINIGSNCNLGSGSMLLHDTIMQDGSTLGIKSLLMKGETLPKNTYWEGLPAQYRE